MSITINGMAHVILTVNQFEKSREFYCELLPFLGMTGYPDDGYPTDAAHEAYLATWNTRVYTKP